MHIYTNNKVSFIESHIVRALDIKNIFQANLSLLWVDFYTPAIDLVSRILGGIDPFLSILSLYGAPVLQD
jgi:hypothetical protein